MSDRAIVILLPALVFLAAACRKEATPPGATPPASGEREVLLRQIAALPEVAPCLARAGAEPAVRLTDAELAGEAATASFACTHAPIAGQVTFFRIAGGWVVSTKRLSGARDR